MPARSKYVLIILAGSSAVLIALRNSYRRSTAALTASMPTSILVSTPAPEDQTYRLRIVSEDGSVQGPELSFEEAAGVLVALHEEGFQSVEGWTADRPMNEVETHALIARATELEEEKKTCSD